MVRAFLQCVGLTGAAILAALIIVVLADIHQMQNEVAFVRPESPATPHEATSSIEDQVAEAEESPAVSIQTSKTQPAAAAQSQENDAPNKVHRIKNPYSFEEKSDADLYTTARSSVVNLYCQSKSKIGSISGSGVVIDPRGVILTNAHVAQYFLLESDPDIKMTCFIRTGSPSQNRYKAELLFLPAPWITDHSADIAAKRPTGTGEHDYALLRITKTIDGSPLPVRFPYLPYDTREAIAFAGDRVLLAGYPAEFAIQGSRGTTLYPTSVFAKVGELLTFGVKSVDLVSLGGAVIAQSGSSGGAVVNTWGQLVGVISTTSAGSTTAERELRAVTLSYVDRDLSIQTGSTLSTFLAGDLSTQASLFMSTQAPVFTNQLLENL